MSRGELKSDRQIEAAQLPFTVRRARVYPGNGVVRTIHRHGNALVAQAMRLANGGIARQEGYASTPRPTSQVHQLFRQQATHTGNGTSAVAAR